MGACNIRIKLGKEDLVFTSDEALDSFLMGHASELDKLQSLYKIKDIQEFDKMFSLSEEQDIAVRKIDEITKIYKKIPKTSFKIQKEVLGEKAILEDLYEYEYADKIDNSISVSKYVETMGNKHNIDKPIVTGTNKEYEGFFKGRLRAQGISEEEINNAWKREEYKARLSAQTGDDIHYILETKFRQINDPSLAIDLSKLHVLTEEDYKKYDTLLTGIVENIKARFPGAQFYPEFEIVSDKLCSSITSQLSLKGINANTINGRIDLLVIDKDGIAHVFDWKTSSKHIGSWKETNNKILAEYNWWTSAKKLKAFAQSGSYGAMLEQYGLEVGTIEIVPLFVEFVKDEDGNPITKVLNLELDHVVDDSGTCLPYTLQQMRNAEYTFSVTKPIEIKELKKVGEILTHLFPGTNIGEEQVKHFKANIDYYKNDPMFVKSVRSGTAKYKEGYRYVFYQNDLPDKGAIYAKTSEELDQKLVEYVKKLDDFLSTQMVNFAKDLSKVLFNQGESKDLIKSWLSSFTERQAAYLENQFRKYYKNGWQLTINEELNNNGIFIFKRNNQIDIVTFANQDIHRIFEIRNKNGKATHTVLGAKKLDSDIGSDNINTLNSQYGNLVLMKIAALISSNPDLIADAKINTVKVINPWHCSEVTAHSQSAFIWNWNRLVALNPELGLHMLNENQFFDDIDVCMHEAAEAMLSEDLPGFIDAVTADKSQQYRDQKYIEDLMRRIKSNYQLQYKDINTRAGYAYYQLQLALLHLYSVHAYDEQDRGKYFNNGIFPTGTYITNPSQSLSVNAREANILFGGYKELYTSVFNEIANPFVKLCDEVYKEWGFNEAFDKPKDLWKNFFEQDSEGNVLPEMILKRPQNPIFEGKPKSQEFVRFFANNLAKFKYRNLFGETLSRKMDSDEYWQVPLVTGNTAEYIAKSFKDGGVAGIAKSFWQKIKDTGAELEAYYSGKKEWEETFTRAIKDNEVVYNKYLDLNQQQRAELLNDSSRAWSLDLRNVFLQSIAQAAISEASIQYGPIFTSFLAALNYAMQIGGLKIPELYGYLEDYVTNKVFMRDIKSDSLKSLSHIVSTAKKMTSMVTLGLSTKNLGKEMITQMYISATRAATGQIPDINTEDFVKAFMYVTKEAPASLNKQNFMSFLNQRYAMSGYSYTEMGDYLRRTRLGIQNVESGDVFIGTKIPDDYYRLTILIAKMMNDGCFEAYVADGGTWKYDMKKDKRFSKFLSNDKSDPKEWLKQKVLFESYLDQWAKVYPDREWNLNSVLPDAYPPKEKAAIRDRANNLYGYFDQEDKSLMCATFLGSAFMQYKTWLSAKLNQHIKSPGFVNIWQRHQVTDENGNKLYIVAASEEELNQGYDPIRYVIESDPNLDRYIQEDRALPWIIEEGTFQQGMVQATGAFLADILTWDMESFRRHWEDPITRGQLINGLFDTLGMLLFAGLVQLVFGEDVVNNREQQNWVTQWTYGVLMGFAQDGPIHQVLGSTVSDLNPPSLIALQRWAQTANSVLAGNKSLAQGMVETFGATRELRGYFYAMT